MEENRSVDHFSGSIPVYVIKSECCAWAARRDQLLVDIVGFPSSHEVAYPNSKVTYHSNSRYELLKQDEYKFVSDI